MNLDDDEIELVLVALRTTMEVMDQAGDIACLGFVDRKCRRLITRIEQFQQDQKEEKADA